MRSIGGCQKCNVPISHLRIYTDQYHFEGASDFRPPLILMEELADCFLYSSQKDVQYMDNESWEDSLDTKDAVPYCSPTTQGKLDFPLLHSEVIGSCYLVKHGQALSF